MNDVTIPVAPGAPSYVLVPDRDCGDCMLCCKLFAIAALDKPMGKWCVHARPGKGCGIYADRPIDCQAFHCAWRLDARLGPEWKPDRAKFFIAPQPDGNLFIHVDPGAPAAWRDPRYYPYIKIAATHLMEQGKNMFVAVGKRITVVLPERNIEVGHVADGHRVRVAPVKVDGRLDFEAVVEPVPGGPPAP